MPALPSRPRHDHRRVDHARGARRDVHRVGVRSPSRGLGDGRSGRRAPARRGDRSGAGPVGAGVERAGDDCRPLRPRRRSDGDGCPVAPDRPRARRAVEERTARQRPPLERAPTRSTVLRDRCDLGGTAQHAARRPRRTPRRHVVSARRGLGVAVPHAVVVCGGVRRRGDRDRHVDEPGRVRSARLGG